MIGDSRWFWSKKIGWWDSKEKVHCNWDYPSPHVDLVNLTLCLTLCLISWWSYSLEDEYFHQDQETGLTRDWWLRVWQWVIEVVVTRKTRRVLVLQTVTVLKQGTIRVWKRGSQRKSDSPSESVMKAEGVTGVCVCVCGWLGVLVGVVWVWVCVWVWCGVSDWFLFSL